MFFYSHEPNTQDSCSPVISFAHAFYRIPVFFLLPFYNAMKPKIPLKLATNMASFSFSFKIWHRVILIQTRKKWDIGMNPSIDRLPARQNLHVLLNTKRSKKSYRGNFPSEWCFREHSLMCLILHVNIKAMTHGNPRGYTIHSHAPSQENDANVSSHTPSRVNDPVCSMALPYNVAWQLLEVCMTTSLRRMNIRLLQHGDS